HRRTPDYGRVRAEAAAALSLEQRGCVSAPRRRLGRLPRRPRERDDGERRAERGSARAGRLAAPFAYRIGPPQFQEPVASTPWVMLTKVPLTAAPVHFAAM